MVMKTYMLSLILIVTISCQTNNTVKDATLTVTANENIVLTIDDCPEGGECKLTLKDSASMTMKEDSIGAEYLTIDKGDNMVVSYTYLKKSAEGIVDADYRETLHFEIPPNTTKLSLADNDLQNVGLLFGKQCFCKGEAGYYKVIKGSLILVKSEHELTFDISYSVAGTSQEINRISKKIQLK